MEKTGRCLCGAVSFAYEGAENWRVHCHCESCRRQTASAFTTFLGVSNGQWAWTGATPKVYRSSPGVRRSFCGTCGAPVAFEADRYPDEIHFYAALLDDHSDFAPQGHVHWDERVAWVTPADDLPRKPA
ncbi:GFA family protein [Pseudooceanicola lipolyticus]|nr:GFA family protein [Pseudooceanicola lipolyticus]